MGYCSDDDDEEVEKKIESVQSFSRLIRKKQQRNFELLNDLKNTKIIFNKNFSLLSESHKWQKSLINIWTKRAVAIVIAIQSEAVFGIFCIIKKISLFKSQPIWNSAVIVLYRLFCEEHSKRENSQKVGEKCLCCFYYFKWEKQSIKGRIRKKLCPGSVVARFLLVKYKKRDFNFTSGRETRLEKELYKFQVLTKCE